MRAPLFLSCLLAGLGGCSEAQLFNGGSRLQALELGAVDGLAVLRGFWDQELGGPCAFVETPAGFVCSPTTPLATFVYTDPSCAGLAVMLPEDDASSIVARVEWTNGECDDPASTSRWFELGGVIPTSGTVLGESCWQQQVPTGWVVRAATEVGADRLVTATLEEVAVGDLLVRSLVTPDGARAPWGLHDPARGLVCDPADATDGSVCAPLRRATTSGNTFADAQCSEPAALWWGSCPPAIILHAEGCDASFHELGAATMVGSVGDASNCWEYTEGVMAYPYDPAAPAGLPALARATEGEGLMLEVWRSQGTTVAATGRFVDEVLGPCLPEPRTDGSFACVPAGASGASYTGGSFLDPQCLVPVATASACDEPKNIALRATDSVDGTTYILSFHELGADVEGKPLFAGSPGGGCFGGGVAGPGTWSLGAELEIPALELRLR